MLFDYHRLTFFFCFDFLLIFYACENYNLNIQTTISLNMTLCYAENLNNTPNLDIFGQGRPNIGVLVLFDYHNLTFATLQSILSSEYWFILKSITVNSIFFP